LKKTLDLELTPSDRMNLKQINFTFYNQYHMLATPQTEGELKRHYNIFVDASEKSDKCIECGKCEGHCPQGIKIRQELKNVKALFE
jgi:predicted aldo/keto reductase-like oxidoreductase